MAGQTTATGAMRPWLRVVLAVSLALNLLVVGLVVGAVLRFGLPGSHMPPPTGLSLIRALPAEDRKALKAHIFEVLPPPADRVAEARDLAAELSAVPFDPAALRAVVEAQSATRAAFHGALQQAWMDHVAGMEDAARVAYAERLVELAEDGRGPKGPPRD
ncbi:periplasmic heavy metal sensor [Marinibacterium sp. SX1]|uniref:periplasmic heavy metal sensor n=1 Tax=Marinibacterium sp. SX1 TaxID=3388424 RepID=UPI003D16FC9E